MRTGGAREQKGTPRYRTVESLAQTELVVLGIVLDAVLLPRYGGAWVIVASFAVAGWIRVRIAVLALFEPAVERLSEFFENALT